MTRVVRPDRFRERSPARPPTTEVTQPLPPIGQPL